MIDCERYDAPECCRPGSHQSYGRLPKNCTWLGSRSVQLKVPKHQCGRKGQIEEEVRAERGWGGANIYLKDSWCRHLPSAKYSDVLWMYETEFSKKSASQCGRSLSNISACQLSSSAQMLGRAAALDFATCNALSKRLV